MLDEKRAVDLLSDEERAAMVASYRMAIREQCVIASFVLAVQGRFKASWHWREAARYVGHLAQCGELATGKVE